MVNGVEATSLAENIQQTDGFPPLQKPKEGRNRGALQQQQQKCLFKKIRKGGAWMA